MQEESQGNSQDGDRAHGCVMVPEASPPKGQEPLKGMALREECKHQAESQIDYLMGFC